MKMSICGSKAYKGCKFSDGIITGLLCAAILAGCDVIISWNFRHIVNVKTVKGAKVITAMEGYKDLLIYPPSALLEEGDDDE